MEKKSMGSFLSALRKASGLTQKQLAEKLNVSDKAVSRWERDECAPDLSLMPALGEIYGVTSDELLRGQRMDPEKMHHGSDMVKVEKQRKRILTSIKSKFVTRSLITAAVAVIGLIIGYIFNFEFEKANTGFLLSCICLVVTVVCQISFMVSGFCSLTDDEWQDQQVLSCKGFMLLASEWLLGCVLGLFAFSIPLAGHHSEAVALVECVTEGVIWAMVTTSIALLLCFLVNRLLQQKGHVNLKMPIDVLRGRCSAAMVVIVVVLLTVQAVGNGYLIHNKHLYAPCDTYDDLNSFRILMQSPRSEDGYEMFEMDSFKHGKEEYLSYALVLDLMGQIDEGIPEYCVLKSSEITKRLLPNDRIVDPTDKPFTEEFGYQFQHLNLFVPYYEISDAPELVPIYTFDVTQLETANTMLVRFNLIYLAVYLTAGIVICCIYSLRQKKLIR